MTHNYYGWLSADGNGNGRYAGISVGRSPGWTDILSTTYTYDTYGNPVTYASTQNGQNKPGGAFSYDDQNRVTSGYGESFGWEPRGVMSTLNGTGLGYSNTVQIHAVDTVGGADRNDYDLNGNMTIRNKGLSWNQCMRWDSHNRLAEMTGAGVSEGYVYDENGGRLRKTNLLSPYNYTSYFFPGYEQTSAGLATRHYTFGGVAVAVRVGAGAPSFLYGDGVQSTVYTTDLAGNVTSARGYRVFGGTRFSEGTMPTDRHFTGQQEDATGIYYFNSRYYDPQLGQFLSPDTIVPDEKSFLSYNRYLYALGNSVKYNDPSGHQAACAAGDQWCWQNRWYNARGYFWNGSDWGDTRDPVFTDEGVLDEMVSDAGIEFINGSADWNFARKSPIASGVARLAQTLQRGFARLTELLGGDVDMYLQAGDPAICQGSSACALPPYVRDANGAFTIQWSATFIDGQNPTFVGGTAVHELAHVMDWRSFEAAGGTPNNLLGVADQSFSGRWWPYAPITDYAACPPGDCFPAWEKWAEAVTYSVYGSNYANSSQRLINPVAVPGGAAALNVQMVRMSEMLNGIR